MHLYAVRYVHSCINVTLYTYGTLLMQLICPAKLCGFEVSSYSIFFLQGEGGNIITADYICGIIFYTNKVCSQNI